MSSAICFSLDQSKIFASGNGLREIHGNRISLLTLWTRAMSGTVKVDQRPRGFIRSTGAVNSSNNLESFTN